jgi:ABC-type dipeptide/oligopeptide/nickel transport system permease subunit
MTRKTKIIGTAILVALLISCGGLLTSPTASPSSASLPPSLTHPLGTAPDGRDLLSLCSVALVHAAREALLATVLTLFLGLIFGLLAAGGPGGALDRVQAVLARLLDSIGPFLLAASLASIAPRLNWMAMAVFISVVAWPNAAAVVRSEALAITTRGYVEAARSLGVSPLRIIMAHYLPAMVDRLAPLSFALFASFVALFGALGFIGVGISAQQSLGFLLYDAQSFIRSAPWYWMSCTLAFVVLLLASAMAMRLMSLVNDSGEQQFTKLPEGKTLLS